jgi:hypothetical protein
LPGAAIDACEDDGDGICASLFPPLWSKYPECHMALRTVFVNGDSQGQQHFVRILFEVDASFQARRFMQTAIKMVMRPSKPSPTLARMTAPK